MNKRQPGNNNSVLKFVDEYVDSFISWDILLFFHRNPTAVETASSLASHLGRDQNDTRKGLDLLVKKGVLSLDDGKTYLFNPGNHLAGQIAAFCDALAQRDMRMKILSKLLSKGKVR